MTLEREVIIPSTAVRGGELIFLSGLFATDPATGLRWHGASYEEAACIFTALDAILTARGSSLAKVVKLHIFMASMLEMDGVNAVCRRFFPSDPPARTMCGVRLHGGGRVEVDCVALV